jgi:hypothetical protein
MKIEYTQFAPDPALRGKTVHLPSSIAQPLIASGVAKHVPYKDFRERLAEEGASGNDPSNVVVNFYKDPEWGVVQLVRKLVIIKKHGYETYRFESEEQAAAYGCPASVLKNYRDIKALPGPDQAGAVLAQAKQEQTLREQRENTAKYRVLA